MRWARVVAAAALLQAGVAWSQTPDLQKKLDEATTEVTYMSFENALRMYKDILPLTAEGSEQWQQAVFGAAVSSQHSMPASAATCAESERLYLLLIEKTPKSKYAPRAMMNIGRLAELVDYSDDVSDRVKAREWYAKAANAGKGTELEAEAAFRIAATYVQTYEKEQVLKGIDMLRSYVVQHPKEPLATAMWQYMGDAYFYPLEDYRNSLDCYKKADALGLLEEGREGPIYWRMAIMADRHVKDRDTAIEYYKKIIIKTPTSGKAYEAQLALKRLGVEPPKIELFDIVASKENGEAATTQPVRPEETKK